MSRLARLGHGPDPKAVQDCLDQVAGVDRVRVVFPDLHGLMRGKTILTSGLRGALLGGIGAPATLLLKDTSGLTAFPVWADAGAPMQGVGDLILVPDPLSLRKAVSRDTGDTATILCDVIHPDGTPIPFAPRHILRQAVTALSQRGLALTVGLELEFHIFAKSEGGALRALSDPQQLLSMAAADENAMLFDAIHQMAEAHGLPLATLETEHGASQFEATFAPGPPETMAEVAATFRAALRNMARTRGFHATFMCKPPAPATAASGWHIHQCLTEGSRNLQAEGDPRAAHWIAGLLAHAPGACLLTNPTVNGYRRFAPHSMAPDRIAWGHDTRGAMVRAIADGEASRIENRAPEPGANPWLALSAQILSGISGLDAAHPPPPPTQNPYASQAPTLPRCLGDAISAFDADPLWTTALGAETATVLSNVARSTWHRYLATVDKWDCDEYLSLL